MCVIAQLYNPTKAPPSEFIPNGRLIAAAPDLLAACQALVQAHSEVFAKDIFTPEAQPGHPIQEACLKARNTIAQATGNTIPTPAVS